MMTIPEILAAMHGATYNPSRPQVILAHALDVVSYCLDPDAPGAHAEAGRSYSTEEVAQRLGRAMSSTVDPPDCPPDPEGYQRKRRGRTIRTDRGGSLNVPAYLADRRDMYTRRIRTVTRRPAMNIVIENAIHGSRKKDSHMVNSFERAYSLALKAEQDGQPCRVWLALPKYVSIKALGKTCALWLLCLKDWTDPIYGGAWRTVRDNDAANALRLGLAHSIAGTYDDGGAMRLPLTEEQLPDLGDCHVILQADDPHADPRDCGSNLILAADHPRAMVHVVGPNRPYKRTR